MVELRKRNAFNQFAEIPEVSDLVEALQAEGVGEVVEPLGSMTFGPVITVDDYGPHLVVPLGEDA